MKRLLLLSPVILFPYFILFAVVCIFTGFLMESVFSNNALNLLFILLVIYIIALISSIAVFIASLVRKSDAKELLRVNMIIKLIHVPAYIIIFFMGLAGFITIFTVVISLALMILDVMTIFLTGLIGLGGVIKGFREQKLSLKSAIIHGILQFVFCADVFSAVIVYRRVKRAFTNESTMESETATVP